MGFWDKITSMARNTSVFTPRVTYLGLPGIETWGQNSLMVPYLGQEGHKTVIDLWRTQPHLRTVVSFRARNIAQLGLHTFAMDADGNRDRLRTGPLAQILEDVDGQMTTYDMLFALSGDLDLYDRAFILVYWDAATGERRMRRLPPSWVTPRYNGFSLSHYEVVASLPDNGEPVELEVPADQMIYFPGLDPSSVSGCSPTIESLRETLNEQAEASKFRNQIWKRGGRVSSVIQRPADAPNWTREQADAFREDWYAKYTGNGPRSGGTPILEDGMTLNRIDFSAQDQQFVEAAQLALNTVASAFHIEPTMIGGDSSTYSNIKAFRKMLYTESLGPTLQQIQQRLNKDLPRILGLPRHSQFVEFNIEQKLAGDFEEQAAMLSAAVGAPYMAPNEARDRVNLPPKEGGDELVVPLNVTQGGQASPRDTGSQNENPSSDLPDREEAAAPDPSIKAPLPKTEDDSMTAEMVDFFAHQGRSVLSSMGAHPDGGWWDSKHWDAALGRLMEKYILKMATASAQKAVPNWGSFDPEVMSVFVKKIAGARAKTYNDAVAERLQAYLDNGEDVKGYLSPEHAELRGRHVSKGVETFSRSFGQVEAGKQNGARLKRWRTGPNPRSSHAKMNFQEVPIDKPFLNGMMFPGYWTGAIDPDETAGCNCHVEIVYGPASHRTDIPS